MAVGSMTDDERVKMEMRRITFLETLGFQPAQVPSWDAYVLHIVFVVNGTTMRGGVSILYDELQDENNPHFEQFVQSIVRRAYQQLLRDYERNKAYYEGEGECYEQ